MVSALLLGLLGAVAALVAATEYRNRRRGFPPDRRRERTLLQVAGGASVAALVGFGGAFGLVPDPGVPDVVADALELGLLLPSIAAYGAWFHVRRDRTGSSAA